MRALHLKSRFRHELPYHLFLIPGIILAVLFCYIPMMGIVMAFQNFSVFKGWLAGPWVGMDNFKYIISMPRFGQVMYNTIYISILKIVFSLLVPIVVALLLNEMRSHRLKRVLQTAMYLPYFLSWVVLGGIILDVLSLEGVINSLIQAFGGEPVGFLSSNRLFPGVLVTTEVWKNFGFNTIIYMAALTSINPDLYEAAMIDGASRWRQIWHVTLPGIRPTIILLATLSLGNVLNAGFEQVFMLLNPLVVDSGDILDTLVYRLAFNQAQYSVATAVGLFKSLVSGVLISVSYYMAYKFADYRIF
ncbi:MULTISPECIES: ABC transporter permease [unclassified Paenibacillus]|uniref:ABC transporter permease n=1 Tax=unclassified Paenibacillus TaxID=185978 RepID=UPI0026860938